MLEHHRRKQVVKNIPLSQLQLLAPGGYLLRHRHCPLSEFLSLETSLAIAGHRERKCHSIKSAGSSQLGWERIRFNRDALSLFQFVFSRVANRIMNIETNIVAQMVGEEGHHGLK